MFQPVLLRQSSALKWSTGRGIDVWEMFSCAKEGNLVGIQQLLARDPSLIRCQFSYRTPIYFAVLHNRIEVVKYLLDQGAEPISSVSGRPFSEVAEERGFLEMAALIRSRLREKWGACDEGEELARLIREGDSTTVMARIAERLELLHCADMRSNQPIHWATMTRQIPLLDELLRMGADINAQRQDGARPIHLSNGDYHYRGWRDVASEGRPTCYDVLEHLLGRGAICDLTTACHRGDFELVRSIVEADPTTVNQISTYNSYYLGGGDPVWNATANGHLEIVKYLLSKGANPNLPCEGIAPNGHALYAAAADGNIEIVKLLLAAGAQPNPEVESSADALSRAISNDDKPMVELLCSHGAARSIPLLAYYGDTMTAAATFNANPELADDPEALANAAGEGHESFVRLMLMHRPELPKQISFPAWLTCGKSQEINDLLFSHGMDANQSDWMGVTVLHHLAGQGNIEKARYFIEKGARLDVRDDDHCSTPLAWAARNGHIEMVRFLLQRGAPKRDKNDPEWATPLAWATRCNHREIVELLT